MKKSEEMGPQIADFVNESVEKTKRLILPMRGTRFVICGTSGSGKSQSISVANSLLPPSERIAESQEILRERDPAKAIEILNDPELEYQASLHIAFNVVNSYLAKALEVQGVSSCRTRSNRADQPELPCPAAIAWTKTAFPVRFVFRQNRCVQRS